MDLWNGSKEKPKAAIYYHIISLNVLYYNADIVDTVRLLVQIVGEIQYKKRRKMC